MHGGDVDNNHTSVTCACRDENHQHAATRANTMGSNMCYMNKTVLSSTIGRRAAPTYPPSQPFNYTLIFNFPICTNGPQFSTMPNSWGFGPHARAHQQASNIPHSQPGTAMMHNTMAFNNAYQHAPPPPQGSPAPANQGWYNNF